MKENKSTPNIILTGLLTIPRSKPPINNIGYINCLPLITKSYIKNDKIIVRGILLIGIEYMTETKNQRNKEILVFKIPFGHFINHSDKLSSTKLTIKVTKEHQEFLLLDKNRIRTFVSLKIIKKEQRLFPRNNDFKD